MKTCKGITAILLGMVVYFTVVAYAKGCPLSKHNVTIELKSYVGERPLQMDTEMYKNEFGETYSVSKFKYYISGIRLKNKDGGEFVSPEYFLMNEDEPDSRKIILKDVPEGEYVSMNFILGVDSLHNCSGAQSGALDPVKGMFWAWNTGYIFMKLEGKSPASKSSGHIFEFHIGGYKQPANCIRNITIPFGKGNLSVSFGGNTGLRIKADIGKMLQSPNKIDFANLSSVTDFHNATTIADNYAGMFSLLKPE